MEPKKIKKLEIKKEVIANLDAPAMSALKGGTDWFTRIATYCVPATCPPIPPDFTKTFPPAKTEFGDPCYDNTKDTCDLEMDGCRTATNYGDASCFPPHCN